MIRPSLAALALALAITSPARADLAKVWPSAQANLPASTAVVIGIDTGALASSPTFRAALALVLATQPDIGRGLAVVQQVCKLDPAKVISGVVIATDAAGREGAILLQLASIEQRTATACIEAIARTTLGGAADHKLVVGKQGRIVELSLGATGPEPLARSSSEKARAREHLYYAWLDTSVLAIPLDSDDKAAFQKWLGKRSVFRSTRLGRALGSLDKRAAIFAATSVAAHVDTPFPAQLSYGALTLGKTNLLADLRVAVASPAAATAAADRVNAALKARLARGKLSANVLAILQSVMISERKHEVVIQASVPEANVLELLSALR